MSVNKFGRRSRRRKAERGPKGEGFNLTAEGDYDMQGKRIRYLEGPVEKGDAVNLLTLQNGLINCMQLSLDEFDAQGKRVGNANDPVDHTDLATKRYVDEKVPEKMDSFWSFKQKRLSNIVDPLYDGEAVNLSYLKKNTILRDYKSRHFDAGNSVVTNLAPPTGDSDAVNKAYMNNNALLLNQGQEWNFNNKRLVNVSDPQGNVTAAVNYGYLERNTICRADGTDSDWDARWKRINSVSWPEVDGDVVNKGYLRNIVGKLTYYMYVESKTKGGKKTNVKLLPVDQWMTEVFTTPWNELFNK